MIHVFKYIKYQAVICSDILNKIFSILFILNREDICYTLGNNRKYRTDEYEKKAYLLVRAKGVCCVQADLCSHNIFLPEEAKKLWSKRSART